MKPLAHTPPAPPSAIEDHVARFKLFNAALCKSALELKLAQYFAGLEVNALYDLHLEQHGGAQPGRRSDLAQAARQSLEEFLEQHLDVTARTARKYRALFLSITSTSPALADRLTGWWRSKLALPSGKTSPTALQTLCKEHADALHELATAADEFGLHELFLKPERDVTPPRGSDVPPPDAKLDALVKFWMESVTRRLENEELHRLPPTVLEAVVAKMEAATQRAREVLASKQNRKRR